MSAHVRYSRLTRFVDRGRWPVTLSMDRKPRHQPCRQRQMTGFFRIDRPEPLLNEPPVDCRGRLPQRVAHADELVEPGAKKIALTAVPTLLGRIAESLPRLSCDRESRLAPRLNLQDRGPLHRATIKIEYFKCPGNAQNPGVSAFHGRFASPYLATDVDSVPPRWCPPTTKYYIERLVPSSPAPSH